MNIGNSEPIRKTKDASESPSTQAIKPVRKGWHWRIGLPILTWVFRFLIIIFWLRVGRGYATHTQADIIRFMNVSSPLAMMISDRHMKDSIPRTSFNFMTRSHYYGLAFIEFFFYGWLLDTWRYRRRLKATTELPSAPTLEYHCYNCGSLVREDDKERSQCHERLL